MAVNGNYPANGQDPPENLTPEGKRSLGKLEPAASDDGYIYPDAYNKLFD